MKNMAENRIKFNIRALEKRDFTDLISNYFMRYGERKDNARAFIGIPEKPPSLKYENKWFSQLLKDVERGKSIASVAEVDGKAIGMCNLITKNQQEERRHVGTLGISIREGFRSFGIGTALINDVISKAKGVFEIINLEVFSTNPKAKSLYERLGFNVYGKFPEAVKNGDERIDIFLMYRRI